MPRGLRATVVCLIALIASLLLVGIVSATVSRHLVQVAPAMLVLGAAARRKEWTTEAALPIFLFWIVIMILIWLWLLGLASIVNGHFTPAEIALTLVIGVCCLWGTVAALRRPTSAPLVSRVLAFAVFSAMQIAAMWLSLRAPFSQDAG
jgi:hypothetical protein